MNTQTNIPSTRIPSGNIVDIHYVIETIVPCESSISGNAYWTPMRLLNNRLSTDNLEYAKMNLETAKSTFEPGSVRLVEVQTRVLQN